MLIEFVMFAYETNPHFSNFASGLSSW
uniref:Uncharacterized protein n=1 Tax=Rhizophora mucronata TaxID=61149 RepID=A0A2P2IXT6_RHIMU